MHGVCNEGVEGAELLRWEKAKLYIFSAWYRRARVEHERIMTQSSDNHNESLTREKLQYLSWPQGGLKYWWVQLSHLFTPRPISIKDSFPLYPPAVFCLKNRNWQNEPSDCAGFLFLLAGRRSSSVLSHAAQVSGLWGKNLFIPARPTDRPSNGFPASPLNKSHTLMYRTSSVYIYCTYTARGQVRSRYAAQGLMDIKWWTMWTKVVCESLFQIELLRLWGKAMRTMSVT